MRTYKVTTPVAGYTGEVGGVHFVKGEATVQAAAPLGPVGYDETLTRGQLAERDAVTGDPNHRALAYFRQAGYTVEDVTPDADQAGEADAEAETPAGPVVPARSASTDVWRAYAKQAGMPPEQADGMSRDQLVEHYTKEGLL